VGYSPREIEAFAQLPAAPLSCLLVHAAEDREFVERLLGDLLAGGWQCRQMLLPMPFYGMRDHRSEAFRLADRIVLGFSPAFFEDGKGEWAVDPSLGQHRDRDGEQIVLVSLDDFIFSEEPARRAALARERVRLTAENPTEEQLQRLEAHRNRISAGWDWLAAL